MFKKISLLTMAVFATSAYANITLDVHVTLTQGESVKEINTKVIVSENSSFELYRCEGGQLIGCVENITTEGAQLNLQVNECTGELCTPVSNPVVSLIWNEKCIVNLAHEDSTLAIEVVAQQVQAAQ